MPGDDKLESFLSRREWDYKPPLDAAQIRSVGNGRRARKRAWRAVTTGATATLLIAIPIGWWLRSADREERVPESTRPAAPLLTHLDTPTADMATLSRSMGLEMVDGCMSFAGSPIIWPANAQWVDYPSVFAVTQLTPPVRVEVRIGQSVPRGFAAGGMSLGQARSWLDDETASEVERCLEVLSTDYLTFVW